MSLRPKNHPDVRNTLRQGSIELTNMDGGELASATAAPELEASETIPRLRWKLISAGFSFFVAGTNDGSMGALLPYILRDYHIGTSLVAVLYGHHSNLDNTEH